MFIRGMRLTCCYLQIQFKNKFWGLFSGPFYLGKRLKGSPGFADISPTRKREAVTEEKQFISVPRYLQGRNSLLLQLQVIIPSPFAVWSGTGSPEDTKQWEQEGNDLLGHCATGSRTAIILFSSLPKAVNKEHCICWAVHFPRAKLLPRLRAVLQYRFLASTSSRATFTRVSIHLARPHQQE